MTTNDQHTRLSPLASGRARKLALCLLTALALMAPVQAFATCVSVVTRYYLLGYEVWRTESMSCVQ